MNGILDISSDDYHADRVGTDQPCLSASTIHTLLSRSPAHARQNHPRLNPAWTPPDPKDDQRFQVGVAAHKVLLEGTAESIALGPFDSWRTKDAKEMRAWAVENGLIPLLQKDYERMQEMVASVRDALPSWRLSPPAFTAGKPEQTLVWHEPNGVACKARIDWLHDDLSAVDDLKSTSASANPDSWTRNTLYSIGADVQAAFYLRGLERVTGKRPDWRFVVVETFPPYALSVISPGPSVLELAEAKVERGIELWAECLSSGVWPAYPERVCWAEAPAWELTRWLEREAREEMAA